MSSRYQPANDQQKHLAQMVRQVGGQTVAFRTDWARRFQSIQTALVFQQLLWEGHLHADEQGWFYVTADDMDETTTVGERAYATARDKLIARGIVEAHRNTFGAKLMMRFDHDNLAAFLNGDDATRPRPGHITPEKARKSQFRQSQELEPATAGTSSVRTRDRRNQNPRPQEPEPATAGAHIQDVNHKTSLQDNPPTVPQGDGDGVISTQIGPAMNEPLEPWELDRRQAIPSDDPAGPTSPDVAAQQPYPPEFRELYDAYPKRAGEVEAATFDRWKRTVGWPDRPDQPRNAVRLERARQIAAQILASLPAHIETDKWQRNYQPELKNFLKDGLWRSPPLPEDDPLPQPLPRTRNVLIPGHPGVSGPVQPATPSPPDPRVAELMMAAEKAFERNPSQGPAAWLQFVRYGKQRPESLTPALWHALQSPRVYNAITRVEILERRNPPPQQQGRHIPLESSSPPGPST